MLTALVAVETLVLALLALVTVGLLRSHAEILRRLPEPARRPRRTTTTPHGFEPSFTEGATIPAHLPGPRGAATPVVDISGPTLDGAQVAISPAKTDTLVAFLSSGCLTCKTFWDGLQPGAPRAPPGRCSVGGRREGPGQGEPVAPA